MENTNVIVLDDVNSKSFEFSKLFREDYLNIVTDPVLLEQPVVVLNLLFQIMLDLKNNMFHTDDSYLYNPSDKNKNQMKMDLWQNEFINTDKNELTKTYRTSQFIPNRNKKLMTAALDFLKNYKSQIYTFKNANGKELTTSGGLIKDWYFSENTGVFEIKISLYWANKIVTLEKGKWNNLKLPIISDFRSVKHRFFILWLMTLKKYKGTVKNYKDILDGFKLNYPSRYEFIRGFVIPIKRKLDNKELNDDWFSFNYIIDENNENNIRFVPYDVKPKEDANISTSALQEIEKARKETLKKAAVYKLKYYRRRHELSSDVAQQIKNGFLEEDLRGFNKNYKLFLKEIKRENKIATDYIDADFLKKMQEIYELQ